VCCDLLQCNALWCDVLPCVAVCRSLYKIVTTFLEHMQRCRNAFGVTKYCVPRTGPFRVWHKHTRNTYVGIHCNTYVGIHCNTHTQQLTGHTARHRNTSQHTLQHITALCNTPYLTATHCNTHCNTHYNTL